jgi:hypothetical protein
MFSTRVRQAFERAAGLAVLLVLVPLLTIPIPAVAAMAAPTPSSSAKAASKAAAPAASKAADRFCANSDCTKTRQTFRQICDFIVKKRASYPTIFVAGYYMRDLVDGYEIFGDRKYLDTAIAYGDSLLKKQLASGFWPTGYGPIFLADTGSALGLLIALYPHVDPARQKKYFDAVKRYTDSIQTDGMILPNGAFGTGWRKVENGKPVDPIRDQYTLSSALTGAAIFTWMFHETQEDKYRKIAYRALKWVFSTMSSDGYLVSVLGKNRGPSETQKLTKSERLESELSFGTSGYVSEGVIAFDRYCGHSAWRSWIRTTVRPNIEYLLRHQLPDGTWSKNGRVSWDRTRSPGIINYLIWYYDQVHPDPRLQKAVQRFDAFVTNPKNGKSYGLLIDGAKIGHDRSVFQEKTSLNIVTGLTGRALAGILKPGVDTTW